MLLPKTKKQKLTLFVVFFLLILLGILTKVFTAPEEENIKTKTLSILKKCKDPTGTLNSLNSECMDREFKAIVSKENLGVIMDTLEGVFHQESNSLELGSPSCHAPGHLVGKIARAKGVNLSEFWEICSVKCGYGCLHGGLIGSFGEEGEDFLSNYKNACNDIVSKQNDEQLRSCWHVVGHGLGEIFGENIEGAVAKCLDLPNEEVKRRCVDGARMEYLTGVSYNPMRESITADTIISFCERFPLEYQNDCFEETAYYTFRVSGKELETIEVCDKVPSGLKTKKRCAYGGGSIFAYVYKEAPEKILSQCQKYSPQLFEGCIFGAVDILVGPEEFLRSGVKLCEIVEDDALGKECLSFFGNRVGEVFSAETRKEICGELDDLEKTYCLSDPTYSKNI